MKWILRGLRPEALMHAALLVSTEQSHGTRLTILAHQVMRGDWVSNNQQVGGRDHRVQRPVKEKDHIACPCRFRHVPTKLIYSDVCNSGRPCDSTDPSRQRR